MSGDEDETPPAGPPPAEPDGELAHAVDDAMKKEVWRALAPQFQRNAFENRRVRPPRDRDEIQEILDKLRHEDPGDERP